MTERILEGIMTRGKKHNHQSKNLNIERFTTDGAAGIISVWQSGLSTSDNDHIHISLLKVDIKRNQIAGQ